MFPLDGRDGRSPDGARERSTNSKKQKPAEEGRTDGQRGVRVRASCEMARENTRLF